MLRGSDTALVVHHGGHSPRGHQAWEDLPPRPSSGGPGAAERSNRPRDQAGVSHEANGKGAPEWHSWQEPESEGRQKEWRKKASDYLHTLAKLAVSSRKANKDGTEEREEMGMSSFAIITAKPLGVQLADARYTDLEDLFAEAGQSMRDIQQDIQDQDAE